MIEITVDAGIELEPWEQAALDHLRQQNPYAVCPCGNRHDHATLSRDADGGLTLRFDLTPPPHWVDLLGDRK
jgi:hypothetical protein